MDSSERSETPVSDSDAGDNNEQSEQHPENSHVAEEGGADGENRDGEPRTASFGKNEMLKALEVVERDSMAIAQSFTSLFASLRSTLSEATSNSIDHMSCFNDAAGRLQECALDAATKGNRYINSSLRLNEEMKGIENLAAQLKILRRNVDALDTAVNRLTRFP